MLSVLENGMLRGIRNIPDCLKKRIIVDTSLGYKLIPHLLQSTIIMVHAPIINHVTQDDRCQSTATNISFICKKLLHRRLDGLRKKIMSAASRARHTDILKPSVMFEMVNLYSPHPLRQILRPEMSIAFQHLQGLVAGDRGHFHGVEAFLE